MRPSFRTERCRSCGAPILSGLDHDLCAEWVNTDRTMIDEQGEMIAILSGRRTFRIERERLTVRDQWSIKGTAASSVTVVAELDGKETGVALPRAAVTRQGNGLSAV